MYVFFFFFKQKTAYEMRISDWSSDVCSSDLDEAPRAQAPRTEGRTPRRQSPPVGQADRYPRPQRRRGRARAQPRGAQARPRKGNARPYAAIVRSARKAGP